MMSENRIAEVSQAACFSSEILKIIKHAAQKRKRIG